MSTEIASPLTLLGWDSYFNEKFKRIEAEGLVAARTGAPPELINNLRFLGSPDATGRRPFSVAGTF